MKSGRQRSCREGSSNGCLPLVRFIPTPRHVFLLLLAIFIICLPVSRKRLASNRTVERGIRWQLFRFVSQKLHSRRMEIIETDEYCTEYKTLLASQRENI
jgi:hypothetical protein